MLDIHTQGRDSYESLIHSQEAINATRLIFLIAGFSMACWAPLVPIVQEQLRIDKDALGLLLIALATGSLSMMPISAILIEKIGARKTIALGIFFVVLSLPLLVFFNIYWFVFAFLFLFGAGLALIDISMNTQAILLEKMASKPIMSSMHAFWSIGGIFGPFVIAAALYVLNFFDWQVNLFYIVTFIAFCIATSFFLIRKKLLPKPKQAENNSLKDPLLVMPKGIVLLIGLLCFILFLMEGSLLDWGAIFMTEYTEITEGYAGLGFAFFSIGMTIGRLFGDKVIFKFGAFRILFFGIMLCTLGFLLLVVSSITVFSLFSFFLIGIGAANSVPILFSAAGNQRTMPPRLAVAAVAMIGYGGMLIGPAAVGFVAQRMGLNMVFLFIAALLLLVMVCSRFITMNTPCNEESVM
ncbi:MFS transporter [Thorsellia kenyensis]|uniref:MFS transporter n=1 Tax=Thorsellia kenyensis TaxID=1549888 RepID=A0ABV6CDL8_9GAMM